ncbi:hypothetical protein CsSME_00020216 [Camellia sinensis var. sinensis]
MHQIITLPRLVNWRGQRQGQRRGVAQWRSLAAQLDSLVNGLVNGSAYGSAQWRGLTARLRCGLVSNGQRLLRLGSAQNNVSLTCQPG